jgi:hypothetical protein
MSTGGCDRMSTGGCDRMCTDEFGMTSTGGWGRAII